MVTTTLRPKRKTQLWIKVNSISMCVALRLCMCMCMWVSQRSKSCYLFWENLSICHIFFFYAQAQPFPCACDFLFSIFRYFCGCSCRWCFFRSMKIVIYWKCDRYYVPIENRNKNNTATNNQKSLTKPNNAYCALGFTNGYVCCVYRLFYFQLLQNFCQTPYAS